MLIFLLISSSVYIEYISAIQRKLFALNFSILIILTLVLSIWLYISSRRYDQLLSEIAERSNIEKELKESEEKYRNIFETSPDLIYILDRKTRKILEINNSVCASLGYSRNEILGTVSGDRLEPEQKFTYRELLANLENNEKFLGEFDIRKKDGYIITVEIRGAAFRDYISTIGRDITDRRKADEKLHKTNLQLNDACTAANEANRLKSDFLANMSHEIRTPMNAIIGMTDLALQAGLPPEQTEYIETVKESADYLLHLLNNILDLSKIEAGKLELQEMDFDLDKVLDNIIKTHSVTADKKGLTLTYGTSDDIPAYLKGDELRLWQIISNLAGNAIKFTDTGKISINVKREASENGEEHADNQNVLLHFLISDEGIGIPQDKLDSIFDNFTQADGSSTRKFGGTGLGLAISRNLVQMMNGNVWAESSPDHGSTFHFTARFGTGNKCAKQEVELPEPVVKQDNTAKNIHILVVEDNAVNQTLAVRILEKAGHIVELANDGEEALKCLEIKRSDIVLMDLQMPNMDGFEATRIIRNSKDNTFDPEIPIIAVTAHAFKEEKERCLETGMNSCITKPFNRNDLLQEIERLLRNKTSA